MIVEHRRNACMDYVIGREPGEGGGRLRIVSLQTKKEYFVDYPGSVPQTVSREHCLLSVDSSTKQLTLTNRKLQNSTWVNGLEIASMGVSTADKVELGSGHYLLSLSAVMDVISGELPIEYSIKHLEQVWKNYQEEKLALSVKQGKINAVQSVTGVLTMASIACSFIPNAPAGIRAALYVIALSLAVFFVVYRYSNAGKYPKQLQMLEEKFHREYVCPNPSCQRFMGNMPYDDLVKASKTCLTCKCHYTV